MLIKEHPAYDCDGNLQDDLVKHYSDAGFNILQNETGVKYAEAIDIFPCRYTYTETDEPIDEQTPPVQPEPKE